MVSAELARTIVGIVGNVLSFGLFMSPIQTFITIVKGKSVQEFKPDPYIATVMNCILWVFYGMPFIHPDSILIVTINGFGLGLELIYLVIFLVYDKENKHRKKILFALCGEAILFACIAIPTLIFCHTHERRSMVIGAICVVFGVIMYASPLTIMGKVIRTKSVKYMPFLLSLTSFLNGGCWLAYALLKFDINVLIPNGLGAISGLVQLIIYAMYRNATPVDDEEEAQVTKPSQVQLASDKGERMV